MRTTAKFRVFTLLWLSCLLFSSMSHGALINRGSGMIYDDILNITWLQDANYIQTSGFSANGIVNNSTAQSWVSNLVFGGYDDWRLPTMLPGNGVSYDTGFSFNGTTDRGFHNDGVNNELGHLFYVGLNNTSFYSPAGIGNQAGSFSFNSSFIDGESGDLVSFNNIGSTYWANPPNNPFVNAAWGFHFKNLNGIATGEIQLHGLFSPLGVWAVRDGDVASTLPPPPARPPTGVPEPGSLALILLGVVGSFAMRKFA